MAVGRKSNLQVRLIDVAPTPVFSAFRRLNNRVLRRVEMTARVLSLRRIAAAHVATLQAHAQVHPLGACLQAFLAAFGVWFHLFDVIGYVCALCGHRGPPEPSLYITLYCCASA